MNDAMFGAGVCVPLRTPAEAAEARAQWGFILSPSGRCVAQNIRSGKDNGIGSLNLDVQAQVEQAVMVDYDLKTSRKPGVLSWERKRRDITNGDIPSADRDQWKLSSVTKTADAA